jgi:hypothetical protein
VVLLKGFPNLSGSLGVPTFSSLFSFTSPTLRESTRPGVYITDFKRTDMAEFQENLSNTEI